MNFFKRLSVGAYLSLVTFVVGLVGLIIYLVNSSTGYYTNYLEPIVVVLSILALLFACVTVFASLVKTDTLTGKIVEVVAQLLKIAIPAFLAICMMKFIMNRVEGFGFILFCDENIKATMQTAENMASVNGAITGIVFYLVAFLASLVGAYFSVAKKQEAAEAVEA